MPREKEHGSAAERQRAYRERKRNEQANVTPEGNVTQAVTEEPGVTFRDDGEPSTDPEVRPTTVEGLTVAARGGQLTLTEAEEQFIRDHFGYAVSERRTLAQRDEVARRLGPPGELSLVAYPVRTRDLGKVQTERRVA